MPPHVPPELVIIRDGLDTYLTTDGRVQFRLIASTKWVATDLASGAGIASETIKVNIDCKAGPAHKDRPEALHRLLVRVYETPRISFKTRTICKACHRKVPTWPTVQHCDQLRGEACRGPMTVLESPKKQAKPKRSVRKARGLYIRCAARPEAIDVQRKAVTEGLAQPSVESRKRCPGSRNEGFHADVLIDGRKITALVCPECCVMFDRRRNHPERLRLPIHGEPNPFIPCACGCGQVKRKFARNGLPHPMIIGHHMRRKKPIDDILKALRKEPKRATQIAEMVGRTVNAVSIALFRAHKQRLVEPGIYYGTWILMTAGRERLKKKRP